MRSLHRLAAFLGGLSLSFAALAADIDRASYGYPISNPFEATIASTPAALRPDVPAIEDIDQADYQLEPLPGRAEQLPDVYWAQDQLSYRLARQGKAAPLIFIIAGTGATYEDSKPDFLKQLFYGAGYHVVQVSSPTTFGFMAGASKTATPGISSVDAEDLYRVMEQIVAAHPELPVSEYYLTGYSLGADNAAFVSKLDESRKRFNFKRVLMINPSVSLYTSVNNLDKLAYVKLPGVSQKNTFLDEMMDQLARFYHKEGRVSMSDAMLFKLQNSKERLSNEEMAMLIGGSFRISSTDIIFGSDLINQRGQIVPKDAEIDPDTQLGPYFRKAVPCNFVCYMNRQLLPFWLEANPDGTREQMIKEASLYSIQDYLKNSPKIGVMTNADDIILGPGDIGFLRDTFGQRLTLYPLGGHCGNINYRVNTDAMLEFFRG